MPGTFMPVKFHVTLLNIRHRLEQTKSYTQKVWYYLTWFQNHKPAQGLSSI